MAQWCHLRTDLIPEAPEQTPKAQKYKLGFIQQKGIYVCGDHTTSASIEGASFQASVAGGDYYEALIRAVTTQSTYEKLMNVDLITCDLLVKYSFSDTIYTF